MAIPGIIYLQPMQCGTCGTTLQIEEQETTTVIVNVRGLPINSETTDFDAKAICPKCGRTYDVEKNGMYFRLYNRTHELCPTLRLSDPKEFEFGVEV